MRWTFISMFYVRIGFSSLCFVVVFVFVVAVELPHGLIMAIVVKYVIVWLGCCCCFFVMLLFVYICKARSHINWVVLVRGVRK